MLRYDRDCAMVVCHSNSLAPSSLHNETKQKQKVKKHKDKKKKKGADSRVSVRLFLRSMYGVGTSWNLDVVWARSVLNF